VRTRPATRASWPETASHPAPFEPAIPESAIEAPQPAASSVQPATEPSPSSAQTQPANGSPQPTTAGRQVLTVTESPMSAYQPLVSGIALELQPSMNPARPSPEPQLYRDNSIAEDLRRKYSEDVARIYPILVATAEDNEAWLRARGTDNPTHRKLGISVRDEYEQWLEARVQARAARNATSQATPVGATCGGREGQPQQIQA